jgi:hypothetical protein
MPDKSFCISTPGGFIHAPIESVGPTERWPVRLKTFHENWCKLKYEYLRGSGRGGYKFQFDRRNKFKRSIYIEVTTVNNNMLHNSKLLRG